MKKYLKILVCFLMLVMIGLPAIKASAVTLNNPKIANRGASSQITTWDCIWFGSYPQARVNSTATLKSATWDSNNDTIINGVKYRRLKPGDATHINDPLESGWECFDWYGCDGEDYRDSLGYVYFKYSPIKWRVLNVSGSKALLVSDKILDSQVNSGKWSGSNVRKWLNNKFINSAFITAEREIIKSSTIKNPGSKAYASAAAADTTDKVFLLSEKEVASIDTAEAYGFKKNFSVIDKNRYAYCTSFAAAMGCNWDDSDRTTSWGLRTFAITTSGYSYNTSVDEGGDISLHSDGIRPAMYIDLTNTKMWAYAGTVKAPDNNNQTTVPQKIETKMTLSSTKLPYNGAVQHPAVTIKIAGSDTVVSPNSYSIVWPSGCKELGTYKVRVKFNDSCKDKYRGDKVLNFTIEKGLQKFSGTTSYVKNITAGSFTLDTKRIVGDGALSYSSSNTSVATVSSTGKVTLKGSGVTTISVVAAATDHYVKVTRKVTVEVHPKGTTLKKLTSPSAGKILAYWNQGSAVTGYQIQYATNDKFTSAKTSALVWPSTTLSTDITGLSKGQKYFMRVRTFKKVDGVNYYSGWSAAMSIVCK